MAEWQFIDWVRNESQGQKLQENPVVLGPGDDAGIVKIGSSNVIAAADMLIEGVHFKLENTQPELIGRKALAVNLSDIAAMGCRPVCALSSIAVPSQHGLDVAQRLTRGLISMANLHNVALLGGDTNTWNSTTNADGRTVVAVTVLGEPWPGIRPVPRSGARPGDVVMVTGTLGGSLDQDGNGKHLSFSPRVTESRQLLEAGSITAMIDLSDGLATDASHIARESAVHIQLERISIPISRELDHLDADTRLNRAMTDGEDFELLFTAPPEVAEALLRDQPVQGLTISRIGICKSGPAHVSWEDGSVVPKRGFEHGMTT